ncbi:sensor histidine kinase [Pseudactinotalea suaedae]|uniref:sensor histidine kinase n=1 Tax=Pseudactinotalea suaedae TaxID=1524924 RepID=UPI0012E2996C|nr:ATP-binding protein [Pseudactinotalea suaedae]
MEENWLLIVAALLGVGVGVAGVWAFLHSERSQRSVPLSAAPPQVHDDVAEVLAALTATSVLLGPDEEVLRVSADAYAKGVVRNGRIPSSDVSRLVAAVRNGGSTQRETVAISRSALSSSDRLVFDVIVAPLSGGRVLVLAEDTTAARRLEEVRRDFVANVSHELKTPVGALSLLAETIADAAEDPQTVRRFSAQMQTEATRLSLLVGDIIDLSRLQAPDTETALVELSIDDVIAEAVDRVRVQAGHRGSTIAVGAGSGQRVYGDHALLVTALRNLLDNGLRYSPEGSPVRVGVRSREGFVEIAVVDQGVGIAASDLERVFERFYRVDPARSRDTGGTGLGLSIVKHVAARHGGDVRLWSAPGRGSTFTLRIPEVESTGSPRADEHDEEVA